MQDKINNIKSKIVDRINIALEDDERTFAVDTLAIIGKVIDGFDKTMQEKEYKHKHETVAEVVQEEQL